MLFLEQVGAQALGTLQCLVHFPLFDLSFVAAEQNVGYLPSLIVGRTCVDGCGEEVVLKTI